MSPDRPAQTSWQPVPAPPRDRGVGSGPPRNPTSRPVLRRWALGGAAVVLFAVAATALTVTYGSTYGVRALVLALLVAALPLGVVLPAFLWLDRFEAEPRRYLLAAFLWGALVAAGVALVFNTGAMLVFREVADPTSALLTTAVLVAPPVEESLKGLFVVLVWRLRRQEFDGITDGIVYAGVTAAGFAFTENVQYLATAYTDGGGSMLAATFVGRCLLAPFAHPMFTVLIGVGVGIAATTRHAALRPIAVVLGWVLAVTAHAAWNLVSVAAPGGFLTGYLLVGVPVFAGFVGVLVWARRREGRLIGQHLVRYAEAGWLAPAEVAMLASMRERRAARAWARAVGGARSLSLMRTFQDTASELALLHRRMALGVADPRARETEMQLLQVLAACRRESAARAVA